MTLADHRTATAAEGVDPAATEPLALLLDTLATSAAGLDSREAARRAVVSGRNVLPDEHRPSAWRELGRQLGHPLALLLWLAAWLSFASGSSTLGSAVVGVVVINAAVAFLQERQASRAVAALRAYLPQLARVRRDRRVVSVDAATVVPGDVMVVSAGDRICADGRLLTGAIDVDMSPLTGESVPVTRTPVAGVTGATPLDVPDTVLSGATCTAGRCEAVVFATGRHTQLGRVAVMTQHTRRVESPLERQVRHAAWLIAAVAVAAGAACVPLGLVAGLTPTESVTFAIGLLVANVPEGLLPTITLALALGVRVLAASGALVTRLSAVETLGSTTAIATDKTGTLTDNRIAVSCWWVPDGRRLRAGDVDSAPHLADAVAWGQGDDAGDPVSTALRVAVDGRPRRPRRAAFPFAAERRRASAVVDGPRGPVVVTTGAADTVLDRCTMQRFATGPALLSAPDRARAATVVERMAADGLRVLAVATRAVTSVPDDADTAEQELCLEGLVGLIDPPRRGVREAVGACHEAGIRVHVVTGDHERTALEVARRVGLRPARVITGERLARLSDPELDTLLASGQEVLFARSTPADKLRITEALQQDGEVVAVTGDGVNDAPALRRADIGVAMGRSGTDVARGAAAMVLTDDDFATIVRAVREGRRAYDNLRKFVLYIFAHAVPEVVPFAAFALSGGAIPLGLTVLLVLAVDLGTETLPALALARERAEPDVMARPPRPRREPLITGRLLLRAWGLAGPVSAACAMSLFLAVLVHAGWRPGDPTGTGTALHAAYRQAVSATFLAIVACQVGVAFAARAERASLRAMGVWSNRSLLAGIAFELAVAGLVVATPGVQGVFATAVPPWWALLALLPMPVLVWGVDEVFRWWGRRRSNTGSPTASGSGSTVTPT